MSKEEKPFFVIEKGAAAQTFRQDFSIRGIHAAHETAVKFSLEP